MEESVIQHLNEQGGSLHLKKLRKLCTQDDLTSSEAHQKALLDFRHMYLDLVKSGVVSEDTNQNVTLVNGGDLTGFVRTERGKEEFGASEEQEESFTPVVRRGWTRKHRRSTLGSAAMQPLSSLLDAT